MLRYAPMDISYLNKGNYKIRAKTGTVLTQENGLKIVHKGEEPDFEIKQSGEYEVEGISVFGYESDQNIIYVVQFEDLRIAYLGNLTKTLTEKTISELENIDVVIMGVDLLASKELIEVIAKLEPYFVLPYGEQTAKFVSAYEHGSRVVKSLNLSRAGLSEDLTEVITFE